MNPHTKSNSKFDEPNGQIGLTYADLDQEWLINAKISVQQGLKKFALPLIYGFMVVDYIYARDRLLLFFIIRTTYALSVFPWIRFLDSARSKTQFLNRYTGITIWFSVMVHLLCALLSPTVANFITSQLVVFVGAVAFIPMPQKNYFYTFAISYIPIVAFSVYINSTGKMSPGDWTYVTNLGCILVILSLSNRNLNRFQLKEFQSRQALAQALDERNKEIASLAGEISELRNKQSEYAKREETFKMARQVAHDIRSPLSALNLAVTKLSNAEPEIAKLIESSNKRINQIADSILTKSRNEFTKRDLQFSVDLNQIIKSIIEEKKRVAESRGKDIQFTLNLPERAAQARVFESEMSRALSNIIENSIDAIERTGEISVSCDTASDEKSVFISIEDDGCGFPKELISQVGRYGFTYGKPGGNGTGLAYAFNVATAAGGGLTVTTNLNKRTEIQFKLPKLVESELDFTS